MAEKIKPAEILKDIISRISPDETLFIGAASGYLFIGNLEKFRADFPALEKEADKALKKNTERINDIIDEVNGLIDEENRELDGVVLNKIQKNLEKTKKLLTERKVLDSYARVLENEESGTAVIIKGAEYGRYWFKSEYDKQKIAPEDEDEDGREETE